MPYDAQATRPRPPRWVVSGVALILVLSVAGCASGPPPLLQGSRSVGSRIVVVEPEVQLGASGVSSVESGLAGVLWSEILEQLVARGIDARMAEETREADLARAALVAALIRAHSGEVKRIRDGDDLGLGPAVEPLAARGVSSVVFASLARGGGGSEDGEWLARRNDELIEHPDDRNDYVIPFADGRDAGGSTLELLIVAADGGLVVAHRRLSHPAYRESEIRLAIPVLVKNATRGLKGDL